MLAIEDDDGFNHHDRRHHHHNNNHDNNNSIVRAARAQTFTGLFAVELLLLPNNNELK